MDSLRRLLTTGRNGNAVLFCGAGLTADCLNFSDSETLGVTYHLLKILNDELERHGKRSGFENIKNAANRFRNDIGSTKLMELLKDRFKLSEVSSSIVDIVNYPWSSVYTTNYDNGLEIAFQSAQKRHFSLNNTDSIDLTGKGTPVIHLHGFAEFWNHENFERSCILDARSYFNLPGVKDWLGRLRSDIERAEIVVFIGFSAADFHLSEVFFNSSDLKGKAFFVNRPSSNPNPDERETQEEFGRPLYIGRESFSEIIREILAQQAPLEPKLSSFIRYIPPESSSSVPPVQDLEDLFLWGKVVPEHLKRDHELSKSDYHVLRNQISVAKAHLADNGKVLFVSGDICDGKSLFIMGVMNIIAARRPVFYLKHHYNNLLDEVASILSVYENSILVIENCLGLREDRLMAVVRQISASAGSLILSSRSISTEAESSKLKSLRAIPSLVEMGVGRLQGTEIDDFIALVDQIAGWRHFRALTQSERRKFVEVECKGIIPSVLLRLLDSKYVKDKYREEYNKISFLGERDRQTIIAALLVSSMGFDATSSLLSDIFEHDFLSVLNNISYQGSGLKLVRYEGGMIKTIPSIGARNLLKSVVDSRDVVNTTIFILEKMSTSMRRTDFEQHLFSQLMRYSILSSTVSNNAEINRFFDHISKISYFRGMPLFWLQWHMAMTAQQKWGKAEEYLEMGYNCAAVYEKKKRDKYNKKQLDDRKAKFLISRAKFEMRSGVDFFRDAKESIDIVGRLMRHSDLTHHPYETLRDIVDVFQLRGATMNEYQRKIISNAICSVIDVAHKRVGMVPEGYQRIHAVEWLKSMDGENLSHQVIQQ